jgi:hypothetical protein
VEVHRAPSVIPQADKMATEVSVMFVNKTFVLETLASLFT